MNLRIFLSFKKNIFVLGADGQLGRSIKDVVQKKFNNNFYVNYFNKRQVDITKDINTQIRIKNIKPDFIINCASYTNVEKAEVLKSICYNVNVNGMKNICKYVKKTNAILIHISSDYVYGGKQKNLIYENQPPDPQNYYGYTKLLSERIILNNSISCLILRCGWLFSKYNNNFISKLIDISKDRKSINVVGDEMGAPTYCEDLSFSILKIIKYNKYKRHNKTKIYNYSNIGFLSRYDFAKKFFEIYNQDIFIDRINTSCYQSSIKRPKYANLAKKKFLDFFQISIPTWENSVYRLSKEI